MNPFIRSDIYSGNVNVEETLTSSTNYEVITNFHFPSETNMRDQRGNFNLYDIYSVRVNLEELIHRRYESLRVNLTPYPYKDEQYLVVKITDGEKEINIPDELGSQLEAFLQKLDFRYCSILSSAKSISYKGSVFPSTWLSSILNFIVLENHDFIYRDGILYADLSKFQLYNSVRDRLIMELMNLLHKLYNMGTMVLNSSHNSRFIKRWELTEVTIVDYLEFGKDIPETRLSDKVGNFKIYRHNGLSRTFAPDPTLFLQELYVGSRQFKIDIGADIAARYNVIKYLAKHNIIGRVYDNHVLVICQNLKELIKTDHYISKALATRSLSDGIYEIKHVADPYAVEYFDVISGLERIDKTVNIPTI